MKKIELESKGVHLITCVRKRKGCAPDKVPIGVLRDTQPLTKELKEAYARELVEASYDVSTLSIQWIPFVKLTEE